MKMKFLGALGAGRWDRGNPALAEEEDAPAQGDRSDRQLGHVCDSSKMSRTPLIAVLGFPA